MFAVIHLPQFSLQAALRHETELWTKPVALIDPDQRAPVILDVTGPASEEGVTTGLTPTQAMARCRQVLIRPRSEQQEATVMAVLLECAYAFSPHLEATRAGMCTLDLRGLALLSDYQRSRFQAWAEKLQSTMARANLRVGIGLGPTPNVARHAARWGRGINIVEDAERFIAALPIRALEPSPELASLLCSWGIRTVGEFVHLGVEGLSERLGLEALGLLAAASCAASRPLHLVRPPERFEESCDFASGVETIEPLLFILRRFVDQLCQRLTWIGLVASTLVLRFKLEVGAPWVSSLQIPEPTARPNVLFRLLHTHLETIRTESPVKSIILEALPRSAEQKQLGLFETALADPQQFQETLARLTAVLGRDRVGTPSVEDSYRADAFQLVAPDFENAPAFSAGRERLPFLARPIRRFRPALRAQVTCAPAARWARPAYLHCALSKGKLLVTAGPWRTSGHWWEQGAWEREEWDAATQDGQVLRLVRVAENWFVEGQMD